MGQEVGVRVPQEPEGRVLDPNPSQDERTLRNQTVYPFFDYLIKQAK